MKSSLSIKYTRLVRAFTLALLMLTAARSAAAQLVVAEGFEDSLVATVSYPTALAVVPDGRVLISSQLGQVYVYTNGALLDVPALDLGADVCTYRERGLLGLAVDPEFAANKFIYLSYQAKASGDCDSEWAGAPMGRVSRFVLNDDNTIDQTSEKVLIDNVPSVIGVHNVDDVEFGKDGYLYISIGDGGCDYADDSGCFESNDAARDMNALVGKVLRITRDGGIPADNPFIGDGTVACAATGGTEPGLACQEIFATGLRNPWRLAFDPNATGTRFFINDVGQDTWEEINEGRSGADYGWNLREGFCRNTSTDCSLVGPAGLTSPLYSYDRNEGCASITGGAFVPNGIWGGGFDGAYLFSDYVCGTIFKLVSGGDGSFAREPFVSGLGDSSATDLYFVPEGDAVALYYTSYANGGEVRRISYVGGNNRRPQAVVTATPGSGPSPLVVTFDASDSSDPDGDELTYEWSFGDGETAVAGARVEHTYPFEGTYYVTVTVQDPSAAKASAAIFVDSGNTAPEPAILSPLAVQTFAVGESIELRGRATDAEDGELPDAALTWRVLLHHNTHTHGFIPPTSGNAITFTAPGPENLLAAATSYLEVQLTATDSKGLTATLSQDLRPRTAQLTFASDPSGATLQIGHETATTPFTVSSWVNYSVAVDAPAQLGTDGTDLTLQTWSDGGTASHTIVTPGTATTYTATFGSATAPPPLPPSGIRTATASSVETTDFAALNAIDGDPSTRWASTYSDPQWLTIDLGTTVNIDRVVLSWESAYATDYMIQVSGDGSAWSTVYQTTSGDGGTDDIGSLGARGRFVRMNGTARATPWGYSLWEFQVLEGSDGGSGQPGTGVPFSGTPIALPGIVQAENFDGGASGVSYLDSSPGNSGGEYRNTDVDIESSADTGGGYNLGWLGVGEWLKYTVTVGAAGIYDLEFRVASAAPGGTFHLEVNGVDKTGPLTIPSTGDWQSWTTLTKAGVTLGGGDQVWRVIFDGAGPGGAIGNFNYIGVVSSGGTTMPPPTATAPHNGIRTTLPGVLQAEAFDDGGQGVAYSDTTSGNSGGEARSGDVDVEGTADTGGGYDIGWIAAGEWLNYSVNVTAAGIYTLEFRVAAAGPGGIFHLEVNGADVTGPLTIPDTGDWQSWTTVSKAGVNLAAGNQVWRLVVDSARSVVGNLNYIRVVAGGAPPPSPSATPYGGTAVSLPGTLQAEHFDEGAASVAYVDTTTGNSGGEFRSTDVDIESSFDTGGGFNLGWAEAGEWLRYIVNVAAAGTYDIEVRVASAGAGGSFHIEVDGVDKTGPLTVPDTGGWQNWTTVRKSGVTLAAGVQVLRLVMDINGSTSGIGNFNWIRVAVTGVQPSIAVQRGPFLQQVTASGAVVAWTTRTQGTAAVLYSGPTGTVTVAPAETRLYPASETGMAFDYFQHEAHLVGLSPQSSYSYDILMAGADVTPGQNHFATAPSTGTGTVRFIAFGDSGVGSAAQTQLATVMTNDTFDLSLHTGDVAYGGPDGLGAGSYQQFEDWVFGVYKGWMPSRPFFPSIGNHDDEADAARPYRNVFVLPENGASSGRPDHAERYYSFDYGPVHFVALDTETAFLDPAQRQAQLAWLDADLAATSQSWKVVYFHRPPYSSGPHHGSSLDVRAAFSPIFEKHGVQLVISGHEHIYERSVPIRQSAQNANGVTYIVTGGGGAPLTDAGSDWWTAFSTSVHHYVRATAGACTLRVEAVRLDGVVFDSLELNRCTVASGTPAMDLDQVFTADVVDDTRGAPARRPRASTFQAPASARTE